MFYHYTNATTGLDLYFQVCGTANIQCVPQNYNVQYNRGNAVQFIGPPPPAGTMCTNNLGATVPCTGDCEILGEGPPVITPLDPTQTYAGVNVAYYGIPSLGNDAVSCERAAAY